MAGSTSFSRISGPTSCTATTAMERSPRCRRRVASNALRMGRLRPRSLTTIASAGSTSMSAITCATTSTQRPDLHVSCRTGGVYCGPEATTIDKQTVFITTVVMALLSTSPRRRSLHLETFGPTLGVASADFNNDGWPDIYAANDRQAEPAVDQPAQRHVSRTMGLLSGAAFNEQRQTRKPDGGRRRPFQYDCNEDLIVIPRPNEGQEPVRQQRVGSVRGSERPLAGWTRPASGTAAGAPPGSISIMTAGSISSRSTELSKAQAGAAGRSVPLRASANSCSETAATGRFEDVTDKAGAAFKVSRGRPRGRRSAMLTTTVTPTSLVANLNGPVRLLLNNVGNRSHWTRGAPRRTGGRDMSGPASSSSGAIADARAPRASRWELRVRERSPSARGARRRDRPADVRVRWPGADRGVVLCGHR